MDIYFYLMFFMSRPSSMKSSTVLCYKKLTYWYLLDDIADVYFTNTHLRKSWTI